MFFGRDNNFLKNFSQNHRRTPVVLQNFHLFFLALFVIGALAAAEHKGYLSFLKDYSQRLVLPVSRPIYSLSGSIGNGFRFVLSLDDLFEENLKLEEEKRELLSEVVRLNEVAKENEMLREQVNVSVSGREMILAEVVGWDSAGGLLSCFFINAGEKMGVTKGSTVIAPGNILIGQVIEVMSSFSLVRSVTDANSRVNAVVQGVDVNGIVSGNGHSLIMELLPQGIVMNEGDIIVTSGLAGFFPSGLLIGRIKRVVSSDIEIDQTVEVAPAIDLFGVGNVFVISKPSAAMTGL